MNEGQLTAELPGGDLELVEIESLEGESGAGNCFGTLGSAGCPACFGSLGSFT